MIDNTINEAKTIAGGIGTILAGRYHILRQLGEGGMGAVWLAEDRQLDNRKVAIKMLPTIVVNDKRAYQQLKSEALVSLKLVHPNIVTLRAFEENNGAPFLVMDYIEGQTLSDYLAVKGKLSEKETVTLLKPIAAALDYAHGEKVIHRDVKPSNIIIRKDGHPFILDFGIAREIQESMTRVTGRTISGTLLYMSPEQLRGASPTPEQDVYSFSAMAYECLKGEAPFTRGEIAYQILNEKPLPLSGGTHFVASIMAGLSKRPESRPRSCMLVFGEECRSQRRGSAEVWQSTGQMRKGNWGKKVICGIVAIVFVTIIIWGIFAYNKKQSTEQFLTLFEAKDYDAAARLIDKIDISDARVQFFLGDMYYNGNGVTKDDDVAYGWYQKAAKQGNLDAEFMLRYEMPPKNLERPKRRSALSRLHWPFFKDEYYKHSVEERQKARQESIKDGRSKVDWGTRNIGGGFFLKEVTKDEFIEDTSTAKEFSKVNDAFVKKDFILAAKLLNEFSDVDNSASQFFNGVLSECRNDIKAAHRWYQLAAEDWCKEALFNLGVFYEFGIGVRRDMRLAAGFYQRSAIQGDEEALQRWQKLSNSNVTVPDFELVPIFDRQPWPNSGSLVNGTEFAALRDDVGRWWNVPFSKIKDFFKSNANQVDGKFFFVKDPNGKSIKHYEILRERIRDFEEKDIHPAVERWNGKEMQFIKANDVQAVRNIVLYYILVTGKDVFTEMNSGKKFEEVVTIEMANCDDGKGIMPMYKLMTDNQRLSIKRK